MSNLDNYQTDEQVVETEVGTGLQRVVWYNESLVHKGTSIEKGGIGVEVKPNLTIPPFGRTEQIKHQSGKPPNVVTKEATEMVADAAEVAVIGATKQYSSYWPDGNLNNAPITLNPYFKSPDQSGIARGGLSLFVVFRADQQRPRKVWQLPLKTFNTTYAEALLSQLDTARNRLKEYFASQKSEIKGGFARFCVWVTLGAGETTMEGKGQQGPVTHIIIRWPKAFASMQPIDFFNMRVSPEEYREFLTTRKDVDSLMATGFLKINSATDLPQLEAAYYKRAEDRQQQQLGAPQGNNAPGLPAPSTLKPTSIHDLPDTHLSLNEYIKKNGVKGLDELTALVTRDGNRQWQNVLETFGRKSMIELNNAERQTVVSQWLEMYCAALEG